MCVCSKWYALVSIGNSCDCLTLKQSVQQFFFQTRSEFADGQANRSKFCSSAPIREGGLHKDIRVFVRPEIACAIASTGTNSELWKILGTSKKQSIAWYCIHWCGALSCRIETNISSQTIEMNMGFAKTRFEHLESQHQPCNTMLWTLKFKCVYLTALSKSNATSNVGVATLSWKQCTLWCLAQYWIWLGTQVRLHCQSFTGLHSWNDFGLVEVVDMPTRHMDMAILLLKTTTILVLQTTTILVPKSTISLVANTTRALIEAAMEMETTVPWLFVRVSIGSTGCGIYLGRKDIGR